MNAEGDEADEQRAVAAFLCDPATHDPQPEAVERIDTHAAFVFLAGERVYKVKRRVRFSFMDFSTLAKRHAACVAEVRLNRRTAPDLYLGIVPILQAGEGLALGDLDPDPDPEAALPEGTVEVAVLLRRFDQEGLLDRLAARARLEAGLIEALVRRVVALHADAAVAGAPFGGREGLARVIDENAEDFAGYPDLFPPARIRRCLGASRRALEAVATLLDARRDAGLVRRCHGDLHLRNIVMLDGAPVPFDCIEFDDAIATIDLGYDLAFLLMDLDMRGLRDLANVALNRYLDAAARAGLGDPDWLAALPLFLGLRAAVRAKVTAPAIAAQSDPGRAAALEREALDYLAAAEAYLAPPPPRLVAVAGLSGTGKSALARALAPQLGASPGAVVLRSDQIRKRLAGVAETERLPAESYTAEASDAVYAEMARLAALALDAGQAVVADAVSARPHERALFQALAAEAGVRFDGLWLEAAPETLKARVGTRRGDASDAGADVVDRQLGYDIGDVSADGWQALDANGRPEDTLAAARRALDSGG